MTFLHALAVWFGAGALDFVGHLGLWWYLPARREITRESIRAELGDVRDPFILSFGLAVSLVLGPFAIVDTVLREWRRRAR